MTLVQAIIDCVVSVPMIFSSENLPPNCRPNKKGNSLWSLRISNFFPREKITEVDPFKALIIERMNIKLFIILRLKSKIDSLTFFRFHFNILILLSFLFSLLSFRFIQLRYFRELLLKIFEKTNVENIFQSSIEFFHITKVDEKTLIE